MLRCTFEQEIEHNGVFTKTVCANKAEVWPDGLCYRCAYQQLKTENQKWRDEELRLLRRIEQLIIGERKHKAELEKLEESNFELTNDNCELHVELAKHRWIPVEEGLPKSPTQYLGLNMFEGTSQKPWMGIVTTWSKADGFYSEGGTTQIEITHWKPIILPE